MGCVKKHKSSKIISTMPVRSAAVVIMSRSLCFFLSVCGVTWIHPLIGWKWDLSEGSMSKDIWPNPFVQIIRPWPCKKMMTTLKMKMTPEMKTTKMNRTRKWRGPQKWRQPQTEEGLRNNGYLKKKGPEEIPIIVWGRRKRPPTKMGST